MYSYHAISSLGVDGEVVDLNLHVPQCLILIGPWICFFGEELAYSVGSVSAVGAAAYVHAEGSPYSQPIPAEHHFLHAARARLQWQVPQNFCA